MPHNLQIKAVQLDLARQMENIEFIKQFIDFSAQNNYNTLFLYLEWRVRCNAVDIGEENGYSKEELKDIIDYAAQYNIDVIPGLAAIGHSELLLANEKFAHLNELYPDRLGKFKSYNINVSACRISCFFLNSRTMTYSLHTNSTSGRLPDSYGSAYSKTIWNPGWI